jgi:hypothetical protein
VSISGEAKPELLSTWMRYEVAPLTGDHSKVGVASQVPLPLEGDRREGVEGSDRIVKLRLADHELSPQEL